MKKIFSIFCVLLLCISLPIFATNYQKVHPVDSPLYESITALYIDSGFALPTTAGPYSADELLHLLRRLDQEKLSRGAKQLYRQVESELDQEARPFVFSLEVALEAYYHTNPQQVTDEYYWNFDTNDRKPLLDIGLETWGWDHFYGYSSFAVAGRRFNKFSKTHGHQSDYFGVNAFTTNLFMLYGEGIGDIDLGMPYRAFGAFGGRGWSVQIGRDRLSWGAGESGNLMLGDHLRYHDTGRFTYYTNKFKYSLVTSFFAHPAQYYPLIKEKTQGAGDYEFQEYDQRTKLYGLNMFLGHRLEWRLFKDKVGFALSESIMFQSSADNSDGLSTVLDLRILNPSMIYHNLYIRSNANSLMTLEVDYTPIRHLNIYGQVAIDEFALPGGEPKPGVDASAYPSAFGFLGGVKGSGVLNQGVVHGSVEVAYTDPFLYLRDRGAEEDSKNQKFGDWGINFVVAHREYSGSGIKHGVTYDEQFLGYKWGPDAIVINANAGYRSFGNWRVGANFLYMFHGTHDAWTLWSQVHNPANVDDDRDKPKPPPLTTPTDKHWNKNNRDPNAQDRDAVSRTALVTLNGQYEIFKGLSMVGQMDFLSIVNPGNRSTNPNIFDFQLSFGISYRL